MESDIFLKRAYAAGFLLGGRKVIAQLIITTSNLVLARILFPSDFGTYALIIYVMTFFTVFSDIGLGAALVQQRVDITQKDTSSVFVAQCCLSILIVGILFLIGPRFASFFQLGSSGVVLFRLQSLLFLLIPFKTIGIALLERNLQYKTLIIIETLEQLVGAGLTIYLAFHGFGVKSFVLGAVAAATLAAFLYYFYSRWPIITLPSREHLKKLLHFGIPVQTTAILGLFYGPLIFLYMGKSISQTEVGYFQIAAGLAVFPLFFSEIIARIMFPLIARTSQNIEMVGKLYMGSFAATSLVTIPILVIFFVFAEEIVTYVYGLRWIPIVPALRVFIINTGLLAFTTISTQVLLALGQAGWIRKMNVVWVIVTWILAPFLLSRYSFLGMSIVILIVTCSGLLMLLKLKSYLQVNVLKRLLPIFGAAFLMGVFALLVKKQDTLSFLWFMFWISISFGLYILLIKIFAQRVLWQTIKPITTALIPTIIISFPMMLCP